MLQKIKVDAETFAPVVALLGDERSAIRRWAAAILGASGMSEAVEPARLSYRIAQQWCSELPGTRPQRPG